MTPDCPHCDSAQRTEMIRPGLFLCPCCGKTFEAEVSGVSGRIKAQQRGKTREDWE
jgi:transposase-like protein